MTPLLDPRLGDLEADVSATKQRSLLALAGGMLAEISLVKLAVAWILLVALPAVLLGMVPLLGTAWLAEISRTLSEAYLGVWPLLLLALAVAVGWVGGRSLRRAAEQGFWSLNSIAVQPAYALFREGLRHLLELLFGKSLDEDGRAKLRAASALGAGLLHCVVALLVVWTVWPHARWIGQLSDLLSPQRLVVPTLANATVIVFGYSAMAALVWGIADAVMVQPRSFDGFGRVEAPGRRWRIAHLSDIHVVGERYGFRIESGRSGPRGNERLERLLERLAALHDESPLDQVLITGDITDAGRSAEWAEFFELLAKHPRLAERTLLLPGNHDTNVVDRANPSRFELPVAPGRYLREMRTLSAIAAVQGSRVQVVDLEKRRLGGTLEAALAPHRSAIAAFADSGRLRLIAKVNRIWAEAFPMVLPPDGEEGLGFILLNSNAQTHFSFTNALGVISSDQAKAVACVARQFPRAHWIVGLHHHLVEYPNLAKAFAERIGTALINGSWFVRRLQRLGDRIVVLHGHRHFEWIGRCADLRIVSAPSPIMASGDDGTTHFHILTLGLDAGGRLMLLEPERIEVPGADSVPGEQQETAA